MSQHAQALLPSGARYVCMCALQKPTPTAHPGQFNACRVTRRAGGRGQLCVCTVARRRAAEGGACPPCPAAHLQGAGWTLLNGLLRLGHKRLAGGQHRRDQVEGDQEDDKAVHLQRAHAEGQGDPGGQKRQLGGTAHCRRAQLRPSPMPQYRCVYIVPRHVVACSTCGRLHRHPPQCHSGRSRSRTGPARPCR